MALPHFCYLVTAFGFTVWTHAPAVILALIWATQAIMFIAGIDVTDLNDYVFWQFLTSLCGVLVGVGLLIVTRVPQFLQFKASYVGTWGQFLIWAIVYLAAQLFYGFFPPPDYPWGILGTGVAHVIIQVILWVVMYYNLTIFSKYTGRKYFFMLWLATLVLMEVLFFIAMTPLLERYVALIAAGAGALLLVIARLFFPLKIPYSAASPVSNEPLVGPPPGRDEEGDL